VAGLLLLQGLPLVRDCMEPRKIHFYYPPYYPNLFMELQRDMQARFLPGTGVSTDVPAGFRLVRARPRVGQAGAFAGFSQIIVEQNIGALLLTPVTLDRPLFYRAGGAQWGLNQPYGHGRVGRGLRGARHPPLPASFPLNMPPQKTDGKHGPAGEPANRDAAGKLICMRGPTCPKSGAPSDLVFL